MTHTITLERRNASRMKKMFFIGIFLAVLGCSTLANAELVDNNNGFVYDTDRNITWYNPNRRRHELASGNGLGGNSDGRRSDRLAASLSPQSKMAAILLMGMEFRERIGASLL